MLSRVPGRHRAGVILLAALVGVVVTASLGRWQLSRAEQKVALQQALDERATLPAVPQAAWPADAEAAASQHYRRTRAHGRWLAARTVYLDNRPMDGRPGFVVVTPLIVATGQAVLVQRGWVPRDAHDRTHLKAVPTPDGDVEIDATLAPPPSRLFALGGADGGVIRQNLDLGDYARETGLRLLPFSLLQQGAPVPDDGLLRHWPRPALNVQTHYGYAAQWFGMSALIAGLYLWFQLIKPRLARGAVAVSSDA
jgi:surfeit locus 1 family protein